MEIYVINLVSARERFAALSRQLSAAGYAFTRLAATDGRTLPSREARRLSARLRFFLLNGRRLQPPELGCALSHRRVYEMMAASGISRALVLEDDAVIDGPRLAAALKDFETVDPAEPRIHLLAARYREQIPAEGVHRIQGPAAFATAYLITAAAAARIREANTPVFALADAWPVWETYGVKVYWQTPFAVSESGASSQIQWRKPRRAEWAWYRALWHLRLHLGRTLERILFPRPGLKE